MLCCRFLCSPAPLLVDIAQEVDMGIQAHAASNNAVKPGSRSAPNKQPAHILAMPLTVHKHTSGATSSNVVVQALNMKLAYLSFATLENLGLGAEAGPSSDHVDPNSQSTMNLLQSASSDESDLGHPGSQVSSQPSPAQQQVQVEAAPAFDGSEEWVQAGKSLCKALTCDSPNAIISQLIEFVRLVTAALEAYMRKKKVFTQAINRCRRIVVTCLFPYCRRRLSMRIGQDMRTNVGHAGGYTTLTIRLLIQKARVVHPMEDRRVRSRTYVGDMRKSRRCKRCNCSYRPRIT
jgi:hypothetical protein